ncbi:hypothetical protein [Phaeodactylibacter sp.]|uniref:hypothetical protein n=1 Tax=Phaeodactylibacter sp. TaxID=1940289 RepID=UPI0025F67302|nr:hypothetical protein [Phaeodactylibacter sp.]MCI4650842.1 hypothetical protein [Phaeodactylibacter sp.]MCI5089799.1 hypothetical protein [Phaeodactylibacter sp.]
MENITFGAEKVRYKAPRKQKGLVIPYRNRKPKERKKLKTVHPKGGVLELKSMEAPEGSQQRYPMGTKLYREQWSRFADDNERYYLYEDHFLVYWVQEIKIGARIYRSALRNINKYTPQESGKGQELIRKQKIAEIRPDQGRQIKMFT